MPPALGLIAFPASPEQRSRHPRGGGSRFREGRWALTCLALAVALAAAAERSDEAITEASLAASDSFWPLHVTLARPWSPAGSSQALPAGIPGVLIRVEPSGKVARIDFGRDGVHSVPVAETDLIAEANSVRSGAREKAAPNFVATVGSALMDAAADPPRQVDPMRAAGSRGFLCLFADPTGARFAELAGPLRAAAGQRDLVTVLFPPEPLGDAALRARLMELEWPVAFVRGPLSRAYARAYLPDGASWPYAMLLSPQGRVHFQGDLGPEALADLRSSLEREFPASAAAAAP